MSHREVAGLSADEHWRGFIEFCRLDTLTGGPDPHMSVAAEILRQAEIPAEDYRARAWFTGLYVTIYNVPSALVLWRTWPSPEALRGTDEAWVKGWIRDNWRGLSFRRERRPVRTVDKLAEALRSLARRLDDLPEITGSGDFEAVWRWVGGVKYLGRYSMMKYAEALRRAGVVQAEAIDMRAAGGWSPRAALAYLMPEHAEALFGADTPENLAIANYAFDSALFRLKAQGGLGLDAYRVQALLCDYKQAWHGRQYPGRAVDSELTHLHKILPYWEAHPEGAGMAAWVQGTLYRARAAVHPAWALGEVQGWEGAREDLGRAWPDYRYMWSDSLYDFGATESLAAPVPRA